MTNPRCGLCTAYREITTGKGLCYLLPPVPICAGMIQPTQGLAGIRASGPQPLMLNARPQVADTDWCAQFHPTPEAEKAAYDAALAEARAAEFHQTAEELATGLAMRKTTFIPGEGIVTREVPWKEIRAAEGANHQDEPWSGAREAVDPWERDPERNES